MRCAIIQCFKRRTWSHGTIGESQKYEKVSLSRHFIALSNRYSSDATGFTTSRKKNLWQRLRACLKNTVRSGISKSSLIGLRWNKKNENAQKERSNGKNGAARSEVAPAGGI